MARPKTAAPGRRFHISGQSVVTIDGVDIYLGPHDIHITMARYAVLIAQYQANGLALPKDFSRDDLFETAAAFLSHQSPVTIAQEQAKAPVSVRHLAEEFKRHTAIKYKHNPQEQARCEKLANDLAKLYGDTLVDAFGPVKLREWRETLIAPQTRQDHALKDRKRWPEKLSRRYINRLVNYAVKMFSHGVSVEMVDPGTLAKLKTLEPLRAGQSEAKERPKVTAVDIAQVRATAPYLSPIIRAMLRIQIATGMRPKEICLMRPCDIDRSGETWIYRPVDHKTAWRGKTKAVPLADDAREAITDYLQRDSTAYCFSPAEAMAWRRAVGASKRTTPDGPGRNKPGTNRKENPKRLPRDHYDAQSYRQAIQRAADTAKVPRWHPYQCRHLTATMIREALSLEHSQAMLGHSNASMTQHYAELAESKAIEASKAAPRL